MSTSESVMENAIAEGLATALCNILPKISGTLQPFPNHRRTPHRKRKEDREVALEKATEPSHHRDFILVGEVHHLFKARLYITQDVDFITHKPALYMMFMPTNMKMRDSEGPLQMLAYNRRNAQPKVAATGHLETPGEVEACLINERTQASKESRQATCRRNKYEHRKLILNHIAALKSDTYDDDLPSWQWLGRLIKTLGEHGMSSEESAVENGVENVLCV
ncbi:hypothetical protein EDC04DRAFT_2618817 [Pisolithus marmoratus]|nr:hypothetical protein EDC04DRAFT_2618817 [Pisolithus marmoratus]